MKPDTPDTDSQQALKQSARRRLIGAAFFVIVTAAVLPMVMDATPPPQLNDFRIVTAESRATESAAPTPLPPVTADAAPPVQKEAIADVKVADAKLPDAAAKTADAPSAPAAAEPVAAQSAAPVAESKPAPAQPAQKPVEKKADKPADKSSDKTATDKAADKKNTKDQYYVQVGVFADADNVKQVRAKLKAQGIASWTEEATGNLSGKTRVKAGPFASKEAADKALAKITKAGLSGIVAKK